ncbi:hypothetical protein V1507DRAFT_462908 [Lipomyces tetrasporus]
MSNKAPLFYGKPRQLDTVLAYAEIKFACDDSFADSKPKKCAHLASLFRGDAATWLRTDSGSTRQRYTGVYRAL